MKNNKFTFVDKFKYFMIVPAVLLLLAIILGAIFHFNLDYDFRKVSNFTVKFNTTVTESEYRSLEDNIKGIIDESGFVDYRMDRIGSGAQNGVIVKIPNDSSLDTKIEDLKTTIEGSLLSRTTGVESSVVVTTTDTEYSLPKDITSVSWYSVLAIVLICLFAFIYYFIRYNWMSGCTLALSILLEIVTLLSMMTVFRVPFNYYFVVPFFVMILTTIINATYMNNILKSTLQQESFSKYTNKDRVEYVASRAFKPITIYTAMLMVVVLVVMFFGGASLIYLGLAIILGLIISAFVSIFINTSLWSFWYKRDKDITLKKRLEVIKAREEKKASGKKDSDDDKIVV